MTTVLKTVVLMSTVGSNPTSSSFKYNPDVAQFGRASALGAECRMFKSCHLDQYSSVVQSVERRTVNPYVTGSNPVRGAIV